MVGYIYLNLGTFQKPIQIIEDESQRMEAEMKRQLVFLHWLQTKKKKFWSKYWISSLMGTAVLQIVFNFSTQLSTGRIVQTGFWHKSTDQILVVNSFFYFLFFLF